MGRRIRSCWPVGLGVVLTLSVACESVQVRVHLKHGNQLYNAQKYEEALAEYQKILALEPDDWKANYLTAASYLALYHPGSTHPKDVEYAEKAIAAFERCLALQAPKEELEKVRNFYLGLLTQTNKIDKAAAYLEGLLKQAPQDTSLMTQLAGLYTKQGDFNRALQYYEMRTQADPSNKEAWYTVGVVCWDRSYHGGPQISQEEREQVIERGIAALKKALELDPRYFEALSYINLLYKEKSKALVVVGKYDEAREAYATSDEYMKKALEVRERKAGAVPGQGG